MKGTLKKAKISRRSFMGRSFAAAVGLDLWRGETFKERSTQNVRNTSKIEEYKILGRTGFEASDIGFGAGFLTDASVLAAALDRGINYIDTGEHYTGGRSEQAIGEVIRKRGRKNLFITTKLNLRFSGPSTKEAIKDRYRKCLERLQTDYTDCLMIHMAADPQELKHEGFHSAARELKAEGKVRFLGLSNHGPEQRIYGHLEVPMEKTMLAAVDDGRFDVGLFVYNFLQKEQGENIIKACKAQNMGVTLMKTNPVKVYSRWKEREEGRKQSGRAPSETTKKLDKEYQSYLEQSGSFKEKYGLQSEEQVRDAAIKFVLSNRDVHSACLSMNNFDELESFIKLSGKRLAPAEDSVLSDYEAILGSYYCRHACGICEAACPHGVPVNTVMRYDHYFHAQAREKDSMARYASLPGADAGRCESCAAQCERSCPYGVPIQALLTQAHHTLTL